MNLASPSNTPASTAWDSAALTRLTLWILVLAHWGGNLIQPSWIVVLLLFSPMILMPLAERFFPPDESGEIHARLELPALVALVLSFLLEPGSHAALWSIPWLVLRVMAAWCALRQGRGCLSAERGRIAFAAARVLPAVGALWLWASRLGWDVLDFDGLLVLLTAAHFHHAGFTLPLIAGLCARLLPCRMSRAACLLVVLGTGLTAAGITLTHLKMTPWVELAGVLTVVSGSAALAWMQLLLAVGRHEPRRLGLTPWTRAGLGISGASLVLSMFFAAAFAARLAGWHLTQGWDFMWATHGTLNTFGFGLCGILAWRGVAQQAKPCSA